MKFAIGSGLCTRKLRLWMRVANRDGPTPNPEKKYAHSTGPWMTPKQKDRIDLEGFATQ